MSTIVNPAEFSRCFVCGAENPIGLKLDFQYIDDEAVSTIWLDKDFTGYLNVIHGGIVSMLLDEVMAKAILVRNIIAMTVRMTIDFNEPMRPDTKYFLIGRVDKTARNLFYTSGEIKDTTGNVVASGKAVYFRK
ncbi:MAG: PaaI family thioesterase [Candidatus Cloacimonetes bacterium]|nr:PaaI family thioesterase [Candidatus Cloacimonadota bacterium]